MDAERFDIGRVDKFKICGHLLQSLVCKSLLVDLAFTVYDGFYWCATWN